MSLYLVNYMCYDAFHFLRVRSRPEIGSDENENVLYKVLDKDFGQVEWKVDEDASIKGWYKIKEVNRMDGSPVGGPGWLVKKYLNVLTLIPKTVENVRPGTSASCNADLN